MRIFCLTYMGVSLPVAQKGKNYRLGALEYWLFIRILGSKREVSEGYKPM